MTALGSMSWTWNAAKCFRSCSSSCMYLQSIEVPVSRLAIIISQKKLPETARLANLLIFAEIKCHGHMMTVCRIHVSIISKHVINTNDRFGEHSKAYLLDRDSCKCFRLHIHSLQIIPLPNLWENIHKSSRNEERGMPDDFRCRVLGFRV